MKEYKNCPFCDEEIKTIAVKCRYCKSMLIDEKSISSSADEIQESLSLDDVDKKKVKNEIPVNPSAKPKSKTIVGMIISVVFIFLVVVIALVVSDLPSNNFTSDEASVGQSNQKDPESKPEPPELTYTIFAVVDVDVLRLRSGPSTDHQIIDRLNMGTYLRVLGYHNEWIEVETPNGSHGWVHVDYTYESKRYDPVYSSGDYYDPNTPLLISMWGPNDEHWSEYGYETYWRIGDTKMNFSMSLSEIIELIGEPNMVEEETVLGDTEHLVKLEYSFMTITCYYSTSQTYGILRNNATIVDIDVRSPQVNGPREIKVGDSLDSLLSKVPTEQNPTVELDYKYVIDGETAYFEKVIYGSSDEIAPFGKVIMNEKKEPMAVEFYDMPYGGGGNGAMYIRIVDEKIASFRMVLPYM
jgi:hypothetical protein